ncbi:hypothetical protein [Staphylococcus xylosus]
MDGITKEAIIADIKKAIPKNLTIHFQNHLFFVRNNINIATRNIIKKHNQENKGVINTNKIVVKTINILYFSLVLSLFNLKILNKSKDKTIINKNDFIILNSF